MPTPEPLHRSRACFVCGTENEKGMGLQPMRDGKKVYLEYAPDATYRGMSSAIHGGVVATLLDEVVGHAAGIACQGKAATAELTIAYKAPLKVGERVRAEGWYVRKSGRFLLGRGQILALEGERKGRVLAEARGRFVLVDDRLRKRFIDDAPATPVTERD